MEIYTSRAWLQTDLKLAAEKMANSQKWKNGSRIFLMQWFKLLIYDGEGIRRSFSINTTYHPTNPYYVKNETRYIVVTQENNHYKGNLYIINKLYFPRIIWPKFSRHKLYFSPHLVFVKRNKRGQLSLTSDLIHYKKKPIKNKYIKSKYSWCEVCDGYSRERICENCQYLGLYSKKKREFISFKSIIVVDDLCFILLKYTVICPHGIECGSQVAKILTTRPEIQTVRAYIKFQ